MSIRPSAHYNNQTSHLPIVDDSNKKEIRQETADIRGFTLMFDDADMETKWHLSHLDRQRSITSRYLLCATVFQGLFFWSDLIEHKASLKNNIDMGGSITHTAYIRLLLGTLPLVACFFVSTGLLVPSQVNVFWINICYGIPSLAIKYLMSPLPSHWDSLFLVYGLCFFILPKISPLNFIFGFSGAVIFTVLFIYISSFRLSFQEWILSNVLLLFVVGLFCYISYSSERVSRERWLLRQRLKREKIDLRVVASSIRDDLARVSNDERPFPLDALHYQSNIVFSSKERAMRLLSSIRGNIHARPIQQMEPSPSSSMNHIANKPKNERIVLFFKGIAAWALCYGMGYTFDRASSNLSAASHSEINTSAAFALLMHSMGFSVFLLYVTGQLRWVALNGVVSLVMLRIFNRTIDSDWVVFSTHTVGYVLLAVCIIVMCLVFGGVVLVWTQLIDFLKQILIKYPHVKEEILENKVLEHVLIDYIADMPSNRRILQDDRSNVSKFLHVVDRRDTASESVHDTSINVHLPDPHTSNDIELMEDSACRHQQHRNLIYGRRPNTCYFCLKPDPDYLIPVCAAWTRDKDIASGDSSSSSKPSSGIPMCTPYTTLALERDEAVNSRLHLESSHFLLQDKYQQSVDQLYQLNQRLQESDHKLQTLNQKLVDTLNAEKKKNEAYIQELLSQHNSQISHLKKQNKSLHLKLLKLVKDYQALDQQLSHVQELAAIEQQQLPPHVVVSNETEAPKKEKAVFRPKLTKAKPSKDINGSNKVPLKQEPQSASIASDENVGRRSDWDAEDLKYLE
jgi:hypothetical protein